MTRLTTLYFTQEEIVALALAVAKAVDPDAQPQNPSQASAVVWRNQWVAGQPLCSLSTALAEAWERCPE